MGSDEQPRKGQSLVDFAKQKSASAAKAIAGIDVQHAAAAAKIATGDIPTIKRAAVAAASGASKAVADEFRSLPPVLAPAGKLHSASTDELLAAILVQVTRIADQLESANGARK